MGEILFSLSLLNGTTGLLQHQERETSFYATKTKEVDFAIREVFELVRICGGEREVYTIRFDDAWFAMVSGTTFESLRNEPLPS